MREDIAKLPDAVDMDALIGSLFLLIDKTITFLGVTQQEKGHYNIITDPCEQNHNLNAAFRPDSRSFILYTDNIRAYRIDELFDIELPLEYRYIIAVYNMMFHEVRHFYQYIIAIRNGDTVFPKNADEAEKDAEAFEAYMCVRFLHESFTGNSIPEDNARIRQHLKKIKEEYNDIQLNVHLAELLDCYHKIKEQI